MQYLPKNLGDEVDFLPADKHKSFLQVGSISWLCVVRHAQSNQNNKFAIPSQNLKETVKDEVDFLPADKHQGFFKLILSF